MAKPKTKLGSKIKKKWFMATAPAIFKNEDLAEITAFEPKNLIGRAIEISYSQLTGNPKDQSKKITLKIIDTKGEKAITIPHKLFLQDSFIQRSARRFKERILVVIKTKSKDGKTVELKAVPMIVGKLPRAIKTDLAKKTSEFITDKIKKSNADDLFIPSALDKIANELKKELKAIYPINRITMWKLTVI